MKFLRSEGRVVCLLERQDALDTPVATGQSMPQIDLLLVPAHHQHEIEASHIWAPILKAVGNKTYNIIYF